MVSSLHSGISYVKKTLIPRTIYNLFRELNASYSFVWNKFRESCVIDETTLKPFVKRHRFRVRYKLKNQDYVVVAKCTFSRFVF